MGVPGGWNAIDDTETKRGKLNGVEEGGADFLGLEMAG